MKRFIITALTPLVLLLGAAPASAHLGDWWTQYVITQRSTQTDCAYGPGGCDYIQYDNSGPYGEHSRKFLWSYRTKGNWPFHPAQSCFLTYFIGHTYEYFKPREKFCI